MSRNTIEIKYYLGKHWSHGDWLSIMLKIASDGSVFLYSIKGKKCNAFLICIMFLFTLFNFLLGCSNLQCTIDESIKGAASQRRYDITFDGNINIKYKTSPLYTMRTNLLNWCQMVSISKNVMFYVSLVVRIY